MRILSLVYCLFPWKFDEGRISAVLLNNNDYSENNSNMDIAFRLV